MLRASCKYLGQWPHDLWYCLRTVLLDTQEKIRWTRLYFQARNSITWHASNPVVISGLPKLGI